MTDNNIHINSAINNNRLYISAKEQIQTINLTNNRAQYFANQSKKYCDEAKTYRDNAKYYAEQNSDVTAEYVNDIKSELEQKISQKQTTLTASTGINITNNVISSDTTVLATKTDLTLKQNTLTSGTNIKTVNSVSLLGSGNVDTHIIGEPVITFNSTLGDNEIWLEGAEVSKTTYSALYAIYGDTYGTPLSADNFVLPDFRNRTIWGSGDNTYGYLSQCLPNIKGSQYMGGNVAAAGASGCFITPVKIAGHGSASGSATDVINFDASNSSAIYQDGANVVPNSIKVRVYTRYQ